MIYSFAVLVLQQLVSGQQCGTVGRVGSTRTGDNMGNRAANEFYIDRGNRAGCAGMITSLSYCFHRPPGNVPVANQYLTTVAVYRPASTNTNENVFTVVSSPITIQKPVVELLTELELSAATDINFACSVFNLPQPVAMETGDVLGACVFDPPDSNGVTTYRLDIVSRGNNEDLVRTNTNPGVPTGCGANVVPSFFVEGLGTSVSRSLHLWANIGKLSCTKSYGLLTYRMMLHIPHVLSTEEPVTEAPTIGATAMEVTTPSTITIEPTEDTTSIEDVTTDVTTMGDPLITDGDSTTATTNRGIPSNPDATTAQPIGGGGGGSNVATIATAVVVVLIVVIALVAILILVLLRRRSKALHSISKLILKLKTMLQLTAWILCCAQKTMKYMTNLGKKLLLT